LLVRVFVNSTRTGMLVVSSQESVPTEQFQKLSQEQHRIQHSGDYTYPKWFIPNTLKYYVLLHDISDGDEKRADSIYEEMKQRYGSQCCYLLKINSGTGAARPDEQMPDPWSQYLQKNPIYSSEQYEEAVENNVGENNINSEVDGLDTSDAVTHTHPLKLDQTADPDYPCNSSEAVNSVDMDLSRSQKPTPSTSQAHGVCLTLNDHDRIRQFIQEFTFRGLLPHIEKNIRQLNDQVISLSLENKPELSFYMQKATMGVQKKKEKHFCKADGNERAVVLSGAEAE
ncbi:trafficking protein particle complex subunit 8 isoform X1, partial [Tachysurus ichikawai]